MKTHKLEFTLTNMGDHIQVVWTYGGKLPNTDRIRSTPGWLSTNPLFQHRDELEEAITSTALRWATFDRTLSQTTFQCEVTLLRSTPYGGHALFQVGSPVEVT